MRDVINKGVSEEDLLAAYKCLKSGWNTVKLYFMMGLPTETDEDLAGIADLAYKVTLDLHRDITGKTKWLCNCERILLRYQNTFSIPMVWSTRCRGKFIVSNAI